MKPDDILSSFLNMTDTIESTFVRRFNALNLVSLPAVKIHLDGALKLSAEGDLSGLQQLVGDLRLARQSKSTRVGGARDGIKKPAEEDDNEENEAENVPPSNDSMSTSTSGRPRRKAFQDAIAINAQQANIPLNAKLRQEGPIKIKLERISEAVRQSTNGEKDKDKEDMPPPVIKPKRGRKKKTDVIKLEPPAKTRSTRSRTVSKSQSQEQEHEEDSYVNDSSEQGQPDVVLVQESIDTITVDADELLAPGVGIKGENAKRTRSNTPSPVAKKTGRPKRTKRKKSTPVKEPRETSVYEDAVTTAAEPATDHEVETAGETEEVFTTPPTAKLTDVDGGIKIRQPSVRMDQMTAEQLDVYAPNRTVTISRTVMNETVVIQSGNAANQTIVLEKPSVLNLNATVTLSKETPPVLEDLLTDDESDDGGAKVLEVKKGLAKQIFNPYVNSPVKKKVEAFEKYATATTTRVTRTKTRQKKEKQDELEKQEEMAVEVAAPPKEKASKLGTPTATSRYLPALTASADKAALSGSVAKTLSSMKASRQQFREREQVRKDKEAEAFRKKEALLQKQSEEKRRKREEREQKAKVQREALEKEKQRVFEQQQAREEEKKQQLLQEKQERMQKQREDSEKRRQQTKQRHEEIKRAEETRRAEEAAMLRKREEDEARQALMEEQRAKEMEREVRMMKAKVPRSKEAPVEHLPIYMTEAAPLLPTPDCYDSDDEERPARTALLPRWQQSVEIHVRLRVMDYFETKIRNSWFGMKAQTPDLQELFPNVDPKKLRRNSSAVWKQAPRFTMMQPVDEDY